jgi:hypothetical protein
MMSYQDDIEKALIAHGAWKHRLNTAIASGTSEFQVSQVREDNRCDFGKWFYSLPAEIRGADHGMNIQKLHAEFHAEAARILDLALKGEKEEALRSLGTGSRYVGISGRLYLALSQWKKRLNDR